MDIVAFEHLNAAQRADCARILREAFSHISAYQEDGEAEAEVETFLTVPERFALAALDGEAVLGLIGGIDTYSHAAELHPLAVDPRHHGKGVGAALTAALEARVAAMGKLNEEKKRVLYDFIDASGLYSNPINLSDRSWMNVPFRLADDRLDKPFLAGADARGLLNLKGHRSVGGMRASIYNAVDIHAINALVAYMAEFEKEHG